MFFLKNIMDENEHYWSKFNMISQNPSQPTVAYVLFCGDRENNNKITPII